MKKALLFLTVLIFTISCSHEKNDRIVLGEKYAISELNKVLSNKEGHNLIDNETLIINDTKTAIKVAEPILFEIYGKENIVKQRPYEIYKIDNYYVISGTLPKGSLGGTFIIIIDGTNSKVLKISHGK